MFCNNCGQTIPTNSKFCNFCGANLTVPEPTTAAPIEDEQIIFVAQPTLIFVYLRYIIAAILTLIVIVISAILHSRYSLDFAPWIAGIFGILVFLYPIYHHILRSRESYTLTTHKIEFTYGLLSRTTRNIPLSKIQDVTSTASLLERMLGIGDIVIDSAAEMGKIPLRKVGKPKELTDTILNQVRKR